MKTKEGCRHRSLLRMSGLPMPKIAHFLLEVLGGETMDGTDRQDQDSLVATGVEGLDDVLQGGLTASRLYLIDGNPGSGKTTLGLQFLLEGARRGESGLYVTLSETEEELCAVAASHGWSLDGVNIYEFHAAQENLLPEEQYTVFQPSEVELSQTVQAIMAEVERLKPVRVVFDSLSEMRLLAQSALRFRRQILGFKQFFVGRGCTALLLDDRSSEATDPHLQSIAHGVIMLEFASPLYGGARRRLQVLKLRGRTYRDGFHDFRIIRGGLAVFPRLIAAEHHVAFVHERLESGLAGLDEMLGGGVDRGTSNLIIGQTGAGK
jgi:circadian clock protein KaiC